MSVADRAEVTTPDSDTGPLMVVTFNLGPTPTYTSRPAVWVTGGRVAVDGFLSLTCVKKNGECDGPHTYGVSRDGDEVVVWRIGSDDAGPPRLAEERRQQAICRLMQKVAAS